MSSVVVLGDSTESLTNLSERVTAMGHAVAATACSYEEAQDLSLRLESDAILIDCTSAPKLDAILTELQSETQVRAVAVILMASDEMAARLKDHPFPTSVGVLTPYDDEALNSAFSHAHDRRVAVTHEFRSMDLYKTIAATSPDGIIVMAPDGVTLYSSPRAGEMFGDGSEDALLGMNAIDLLAPEDRERARGDLGCAASGESLRNLVYVALRRDATRFITDVSLSPIRNGIGEPVAVVVVVRDCTDREEAAQELEYASRRFRALVERSSDITLIIGPDMNISYASPSMRTILDYDPDELVGTGAVEFVHPDDLAAAQALLQLASDSDTQVPQFVVRIRHSDGSWRSIEANLTDGRNDPAVGGFLLNCRDVTDRVNAEKESRAIRKHMMKSQRLEAVGQLAAGVAHDFNNLLTAVDGYADISLGKMSTESPGRGEVEQIVKISRRAAELTRQLLIVGHDQITDMKPMDLNRNIKDVIEMLSRTIGDNIEVLFAPQEELWAITADSGNIGQVIMNLAVNAKNAMPDGGKVVLFTKNVTLEAGDVAGMPGGRTGRFVVLGVRDTGVGMSADVVDRIFEPFYTTRDESGGTGMGLAVVQGIVDQHRGWICVKSEPGGGTEFRLYLPVSLDSSADTVADETRRGLAEGGHGERILLVEDDEMIRRLFREALAGHGYEVSDARDTAGAMGQFESRNGDFHLLFSDVMLPDGTGPELACRLTKIKPELQVLLTTGYAGESLRTSGDDCPDFACLRKPYSISTLLSAVRDAITQ